MKIHVIYEGDSTSIGNSSYIRWIIPNKVSPLIPITYSLGIPKYIPDILIIDRLHGIKKFQDIVYIIKWCYENNVILVHSIDDNYLALASDKPDRGLNVGKIFDMYKSEHLFAKYADVMIYSCEYLAKYYERYASKLSYVLPNYISKRFINKKTHSHPIIIGYMGTPTHTDDFKLALPAIEEILDTYPNVYLELFGIGNKLGNVHIKAYHHKYVGSSYEDYQRYVKDNINWDIGIAPLIDNNFNRSKTDIKFLDYTAMGCVGVYSNVEPYKNIIGLHASNWFDELTFLINNEDYRKQLYNHALEYVLKNRLIENNIDVYSRIFADIYDQKDNLLCIRCMDKVIV